MHQLERKRTQVYLQSSLNSFNDKVYSNEVCLQTTFNIVGIVERARETPRQRILATLSLNQDDQLCPATQYTMSYSPELHDNALVERFPFFRS